LRVTRNVLTNSSESDLAIVDRQLQVGKTELVDEKIVCIHTDSRLDGSNRKKGMEMQLHARLIM
jgi:hypothetical protein